MKTTHGKTVGAFLFALTLLGLAPAGEAEAASLPDLARNGLHRQTGTYVGRLVVLTMEDDLVYAPVKVLSESSFAITVSFRNAPLALPWRRIKSIQVAR